MNARQSSGSFAYKCVFTLDAVLFGVWASFPNKKGPLILSNLVMRTTSSFFSTRSSLPTAFSSSASASEILQRGWLVQECPSPVGADGQSAWVILGPLFSDAQLSCAVTIGCCRMPDLYHILFASFSCHRTRDLWNFFKAKHPFRNNLIGVSRGEIAEATIANSLRSFFYGSRKLIAELLASQKGSHF